VCHRGTPAAGPGHRWCAQSGRGACQPRAAALCTSPTTPLQKRTHPRPGSNHLPVATQSVSMNLQHNAEPHTLHRHALPLHDYVVYVCIHKMPCSAFTIKQTRLAHTETDTHRYRHTQTHTHTHTDIERQTCTMSCTSERQPLAAVPKIVIGEGLS